MTSSGFSEGWVPSPFAGGDKVLARDPRPSEYSRCFLFSFDNLQVALQEDILPPTVVARSRHGRNKRSFGPPRLFPPVLFLSASG